VTRIPTTPVVPVSAGEVFSATQRQEIDRVLIEAERISGRDICVHVGASDGDPRASAERLHASLRNPANSIVVYVDPATRSLEIVTGSSVRESMSNRQAALAAITMQSAFVTGDLAHGLRSGLQQIALMARKEQSLHTHTP